MRAPRVRFTVRGLMAAIAALALFLGGVAASRRSTVPQPAVYKTRAQQLAERRGTHLNPGDIGVGPRLQREIIAQFERQDPRPEPRAAHFRWLEQPGLRVVGWYGLIRKVSPQGDGLRVEVVVAPHLDWDRANITFTPDYFVETYTYGPRGLTFVAGYDPPNARQALFGD